jgi:hypothetical protein
MPRITMSYRRDDSLDITGRIFDRLAGHFGREAVFRASTTFPPGADFRRHIDRVLEESDIVLAIVGQRWIGPDDEQRRLASPADTVRLQHRPHISSDPTEGAEDLVSRTRAHAQVRVGLLQTSEKATDTITFSPFRSQSAVTDGGHLTLQLLLLGDHA